MSNLVSQCFAQQGNHAVYSVKKEPESVSIL